MFFVKDIVDFEGVVEMSVSFISRGSRAELALGCPIDVQGAPELLKHESQLWP